MSEGMRTVSRLAGGQWGLLTTAQAGREGVSRLTLSRLAAAGLLERRDQGVYAITGTIDDLTEIRAAWLALAPNLTAEERLDQPITTGVASHATAARLHGLGDLRDDVAEFTLATNRRTRREGVRLHHAALHPDEVTIALGIPTTTVERTIADLLTSDRGDVQHIADIAGQAFADGKLAFNVLSGQLAPHAASWDQPDGEAAAAWLLDLAGYNAAATVAALESTAAGHEVLQRTVMKLIGLGPSADTLANVKAITEQLDNSQAIRTAEMARKMMDNPALTQAVDTAALVDKLVRSVNPSGFAEIQRQAAAFAALARDLDLDR